MRETGSPVCTECGRSGDKMYENGHTTVARCLLHPRAKVYRLNGGRILFGRKK